MHRLFQAIVEFCKNPLKFITSGVTTLAVDNQLHKSGQLWQGDILLQLDFAGQEGLLEVPEAFMELVGAFYGRAQDPNDPDNSISTALVKARLSSSGKPSMFLEIPSAHSTLVKLKFVLGFEPLASELRLVKDVEAMPKPLREHFNKWIQGYFEAQSLLTLAQSHENLLQRNARRTAENQLWIFDSLVRQQIEDNYMGITVTVFNEALNLGEGFARSCVFKRVSTSDDLILCILTALYDIELVIAQAGIVLSTKTRKKFIIAKEELPSVPHAALKAEAVNSLGLAERGLTSQVQKQIQENPAFGSDIPLIEDPQMPQLPQSTNRQFESSMLVPLPTSNVGKNGNGKVLSH